MKICCTNCHNLVDEEHTRDTQHDGKVCIRCLSLYHKCPRCNEYTKYVTYCSMYNRNVCDDCHLELLHGLHGHDFKQDVYFDGNRTKSLHIGVELEIQQDFQYDYYHYPFARKNFLKEFISEFGNKKDSLFIAKYDGSLRDSSGVEIVSQPMTIYNLLSSWKKMFELINKYKYDNFDNCGLHFHLDKKYLNKRIIRNMDFFINNFDYFFSMIGGRNFGRYCNLSWKERNDWGRNTVDRYHAVNLTNKNTVELRFCKSTNDFETFKKRIEYIFALVAYCNTVSKKDMFVMPYQTFKEQLTDIFNQYHSQLTFDF